jgi:hypothetical protein
MPLTINEVKNAKAGSRDYKLADSQGLFLFVSKSGGKTWRFKYRKGPKEKLLTLGRYPDVGLVAAREAHSLRIYPDRLVIAAEGQIVCEHARLIDRSHNKPGRTIYDWRHYLAVIQRKPGALRNGAPFLEMPRPFGSYRAICSSAQAATERWLRSCPWFFITTSRLS